MTAPAGSRSVALFDYFVADPHTLSAGRGKQTAYGAIHFALLEALCDEFDFTVFAIDFDNPRPDRIKFVRVPAVVLKPLAVLFITFHVSALYVYVREILKRRKRFDVVQCVESNFSLPTVSHAQFNHKAFLRKGWPIARPSGIRRPLRRIDYQLRRTVEPFVYRKADRVVTSSKGLLEDIVESYPWVADRAEIIQNAIDVTSHTRPDSFDPATVRAPIGIGPDDTVLTFTALGDFELKGMLLIFEAMKQLGRDDLHFVSVGGPPPLVDAFSDRARAMGVGDHVHLMGMQPDVRPFLWSADAFVFPSAYESFSLATAHAAAAGLPLIVTPFHLAREIVDDGVNGYLVERSVAGIAKALEAFLALTPDQRHEMGRRSRQGVEVFSPTRFVAGWRHVYDCLIDPTP
jgi:glycosyltransferase involved in cell wall biosynthesis